jgi:UPF0176 protein
MTVAIAAFYKFTPIEDPEGLRAHLFALLSQHAIKGTILIAAEGINGTISGNKADMAAVMSHLRADSRFADLESKDAIADAPPFQRLKVKVKREILTLRHPEADPTKQVGTYITPQDWNTLIADPDVLLIDTRNSYEIEAGTFPGAVDPGTRHFGQFPDYVARNLDPARHRKIAMFCTGGIRCEKASAYLLAHGFDQVFHLKGGILNYLAQMPPDQNHWQGECFVFDERETVSSTDDDETT